jgi:hypothetical protein
VVIKNLQSDQMYDTHTYESDTSDHMEAIAINAALVITKIDSIACIKMASMATFASLDVYLTSETTIICRSFYDCFYLFRFFIVYILTSKVTFSVL